MSPALPRQVLMLIGNAIVSGASWQATACSSYGMFRPDTPTAVILLLLLAAEAGAEVAGRPSRRGGRCTSRLGTTRRIGDAGAGGSGHAGLPLVIRHGGIT